MAKLNLAKSAGDTLYSGACLTREIVDGRCELVLGASSPAVLAPGANTVSASLGATVSEIQLPCSVNHHSDQAELGYYLTL